MSALRGGAALGAASLIGILLNYGFLVVSGRLLGSEDYGNLAAILGLLTVVLLPSSALQLAVAREVSRLEASGSFRDAAAFRRVVIRAAAILTVPVIGLTAILTVPAARIAEIPESALALASVALVAALLGPVAMGIIQGEQRFHLLAALIVLPFVVRLVTLAVASAGTVGLTACVAAITLSSLAVVAASLAALRGGMAESSAGIRSLAPFGRYLVPVIVGLIGMSILVNVDVIVVNARFDDTLASAYAAAAAFGRVGYFLPATILTVLFPRTAARQARGEQTDDILGRSLIVTGAFCLGLAAFYYVAGSLLVRLSYGAEFSGAVGLLPLFALEMMLVSAANVLVGFHLSRGETRFAWIVAGSVPVQLVALATLPDTLREVIWVNIAVALGLLLVHELAVGSSWLAIRAGATRLLGAR